MDQLVNQSPKSLEADGERFIPGKMYGSIELEHFHRYQFAAQVVSNKAVLDIASGEGYGSAHLAKFAKYVTGVDISSDAIEHAKTKYTGENLEFRIGSCSHIPMEDRSVDVVVSFETIEHHAEHELMMQEIKRVLRPGGFLVISSPDKYEYSDKPRFSNPFHVKELYLDEFKELLNSNFKNVKFYGQRVLLGSALFRKDEGESLVFHERGKDSAPNQDLPTALYWVAVASDGKLPKTYGGILEQSLSDLWRDITSQRNAVITAIINTLAEPESELLKNQIKGHWYSQQNQDLIQAGVDPYIHWVTTGIKEGRLPSPDPIKLSSELLVEREEMLRSNIELIQARLHQLERDYHEQQDRFKVEIARARLNSREEVDTLLRTLSEKEHEFAEQLAGIYRETSSERTAQIEATQRQREIMAAEYTKREQQLRIDINALQSQLERRVNEFHEQQQLLRDEITQTRLQAQQEINEQLENAQHQKEILGNQNSQREEELLSEISRLEGKLRQVELEFQERQRALETEIVQTRLKGRYEIDTHLRAYAERERQFGEQLVQLQQEIAKKQADEVKAAQLRMEIRIEQHVKREEELRAEIKSITDILNQTRQEFHKRQTELENDVYQEKLLAQNEINTHVCKLVEQERKFGEKISQLQRENNQSVQVQLRELSAQYARSEENLRKEVSFIQAQLYRTERELSEQRQTFEATITLTKLQARDEIDAQLRILAERERVFGDTIAHIQRDKNHELATQIHASHEQLEILVTHYASREDNLRNELSSIQAQLYRTERELSEQRRIFEATIARTELKARDEISNQTGILADRERVFGDTIAQIQRDKSHELATQIQTSREQLEVLVTHYASREDNLRKELSSIQTQLYSTERELSEQRRIFEATIAKTELKARDEISNQTHILADRERIIEDQLSRQKQEALKEREVLTQKYARYIAEISAQLESIQKSWTWRMILPLRVISQMFGSQMRKPDSSIDSGFVPTFQNHETITVSESQVIGSITSESASMENEKSVRVLANPTQMTTISAASSIDRLLEYDDEAFIVCAYLTLLGRSPDPQGFAYYMGRLNDGIDKHDIIYQLYSSPEFGQRKLNITGLEKSMKRWRWQQLIIIGPLLRKRYVGILQKTILRALRGIEGRIDALDSRIEHHLKEVEQSVSLPPKFYVNAQIGELFKSFDGQKYLEAHPDVAAAGVNPYEHFIVSGWDEGRYIPSSLQLPTPDTDRDEKPLDNIGIMAHKSSSDLSSSNDVAAYLMETVEDSSEVNGYPFTRLMHYIWNFRIDLQKVFDLNNPHGKLGYCKWFLCSASDEYGLTPDVYSTELLEKLNLLGGDIAVKAQAMLEKKRVALQRPVEETGNIHTEIREKGACNEPMGTNLVGYAFGEFGRGEDVRMMARALNTVETPFCVINQDVGMHGSGDDSVKNWISVSPRYGTNVFHINADILPALYFKFGAQFFNNRFNIGYWAWELSKCPPEFDLALNMIDEVWAISDFVAESFKSRSPVSVITMPLAVSVPDLDSSLYTKRYYDLSENSFVFLFTFDAASYLDRKNPIAVVRAFTRAFPEQDQPVHLLLKTMNVQMAEPKWKELLDEVGLNPRITITSERMTRDEVLGLYLACDAFVSLHRAEGFGRCVAEAMAYGKPVVTTNYSGTRDFAREGTACVVDYSLVPVAENAYPFWKDQLWAEPDIDHAAILMRRLVEDEIYRKNIAIAGKQFVLDNFNEATIGKRYRKRLFEIHSNNLIPIHRSNAHLSFGNEIPTKDEEFYGNVDIPNSSQCLGVSEVLSIEGWVLATSGIVSMEICVDSEFMGNAHYGVLRPDVFSEYPHISAAARSGFSFRLNVNTLSLGNHNLEIIAKSNNGNHKRWILDFTVVPAKSYERWVENAEKYYGKFKIKKNRIDKLYFSVVLKINSIIDRDSILDTMNSLKNQVYQNFEIIVVANGATRNEIMHLVEIAQLSEKIMMISENYEDWWTVFSACKGDLIGVVEDGDVLLSWALDLIIEKLRKIKIVDFVYADEDLVKNRQRSNPKFKPSWSPIFLDGYNYIGKPWFASRKALNTALNGNSSIEDEHTLLKAIGRVSTSICHIPTVLISRMKDSYTFDTYTNDARIRRLVSVNANEDLPKVSIIIPSRLGNIDLINRCFSGLQQLTDYPNFEVLVVLNNLVDPSVESECRAKWPFRFLSWDSKFNWSGINNFGARNTTGDYLLFMNDDVEPLDKYWLRNMVIRAQSKSIAAIGALLEYPNGTIQHMGINLVNKGGGARHLFRFCRADEYQLDWLINNAREVSAVTGACMLVKRACFDLLGGFDERLTLVCNDTDFCLRLSQRGFSIVIEPAARLIHHEGISRAGLEEGPDVKIFRERWGKLLNSTDRFTNPNLDPERDDWAVDSNVNLELIDRMFGKVKRVPVVTERH